MRVWVQKNPPSVVVSRLNNFIPTDSEVPPGIAALCALYEHVGQAEDM